jgi:hypothetical protein
LPIKRRRHHCVVSALCIALVAAGFAFAQEKLPAPPSDRTLVYVQDASGNLSALPFETGTTPLRADAVAKSDKTSYIHVQGASAQTTLASSTPRFYLFVPDEAGVHPPFIVRLKSKRDARRATAIAQRGLRGYAVASEEIVKPHYRVLAREGGAIFMEVRPREPLAVGEYAILGSDLKRISTFRITTTQP